MAMAKMRVTLANFLSRERMPELDFAVLALIRLRGYLDEEGLDLDLGFDLG